MVRPLPFRNFRWVKKKHLERLQKSWSKWRENSKTGYIMEVTLEYPSSLHTQNAHQNFPLAPVTETIRYDDLSPEAQRNCKSKAYKATKQIPHFKPRTRYVVHYMVSITSFTLC